MSSDLSQRPLPWLIAILIASLSVVAKLALTSGPLLPGLDGAYYWVQVRSLMEHGTLAFSDLPLLFWLQAGLSWAARVVTGTSLEVLIPAVVRATDAVLPSLSLLPVLVLARQWHKPWLAPLLLLPLLFHPVQLYFFTGDFIKNEAALPLALALGVLLTSEHRVPRRSVLMGALLLGITALTHFGVLQLCGVMIAVWALARAFSWSWTLRLLALGLVVVLVAAGAALLGFLAPSRLDRLISAVADLGSLFRNSVWELAGYGASSVRPALLFTAVTAQVGVLFLAGLAWGFRRQLKDQDAPALVAFLVTAFAFSSPVLGVEWFDRLAALSFVPLALAAGLLVARSTSPSARLATWSVGGLLAGGTLLVSLALAPQGATAPAVTASTWNEVQTLARNQPLPEDSLVVARHGLEFLVAWVWHSDVVQDRFAGPDVGQGYAATYVLIDKADEARSPRKGEGPPKDDKVPPPPPGPKEFGKGSQPTGPVEVLYDSSTLILLKLNGTPTLDKP